MITHQLYHVTLSVLVSGMSLTAASTYDNQNAGLTDVPHASLTYATLVIKVRGNNLTTLGANEFAAYPGLYSFQAQENLISSVDDTAFQNTVLDYCALSYNLLTYVPDFTAVKSTMQKLKLIGNQILAMDDSHLNQLTVLKNMYINDNQIAAWPDFSSIGLANGNNLYMQGNEDLPCLEPANMCQFGQLRLDGSQVQHLILPFFSAVWLLLQSLDPTTKEVAVSKAVTGSACVLQADGC